MKQPHIFTTPTRREGALTHSRSRCKCLAKAFPMWLRGRWIPVRSSWQLLHGFPPLGDRLGRLINRIP